MPLFVRIKRKANEQPYEFLETHKAKRIKSDGEAGSCQKFEYKGTYSVNNDLNGAIPDIHILKKEPTVCSRKITWDAYTASYCDDMDQGDDKKFYNVDVHNEWKKSEAPSDKKTKVLDQPVLYRIIDLHPAYLEEDKMTLNGEVLNEEMKTDENEDYSSDYIYDVYQYGVPDELDESPISTVFDFAHTSAGKNKHREKFVRSHKYDEACYSSGDDDISVDDDEDSNSENNWRNDYPDEEDIFGSCSSLSSSSEEFKDRKLVWRERLTDSDDSASSDSSEHFSSDYDDYKSKDEKNLSQLESEYERIRLAFKRTL